MHVNTPELLLHISGIDLAHITSTIAFPQLSDPQLPSARSILGNANPRIVGHYTCVQCKYRLVFSFHPTDLKKCTNINKCTFNLTESYQEWNRTFLLFNNTQFFTFSWQSKLILRKFFDSSAVAHQANIKQKMFPFAIKTQSVETNVFSNAENGKQSKIFPGNSQRKHST